MRRWAGAAAVAAFLACPATAAALPSLQITEHVVPATAATGQVVEARVTVTNNGDTATESKTEIYWAATNGEGFVLDEFEMRSAVCPPGSDEMDGRGTCLISAPIAPGASLTATFSGSSRYPLSLEARARVYYWGTGAYSVDERPLTITGPVIPLPLAARITSLKLKPGRLHPGQRARLRYRLERRAQKAHAMLLQCVSASGCRRTKFVLSSVVRAPRGAGWHTLRYPLPTTLVPGRYRIRLWTSEREHRDHWRSVTFRVAR